MKNTCKGKRGEKQKNKTGKLAETTSCEKRQRNLKEDRKALT